MRYLTLITLCLAIAVSCQNRQAEKSAVEQTTTEQTGQELSYVSYDITIEGMTCTGCEETIESGVKNVEGVDSVEASHTDGHALVKFVEGKADTLAVKKAIEEAGYKVISFSEAGDKEAGQETETEISE